MRIILNAAGLGICLAIAGCSQPTQDKTSADLKAAASEVKDAAKEVAATPEMKAVGADIKQGASEAGDKLEAATDKAGEKLKEGAKTAGDKTEAALDKANDDAKN